MKDKNIPSTTNTPPIALDFDVINNKSHDLADLIERQHDKLVDILVNYESHEVAVDEISRSLDLLRHIDENKDYFKQPIGPVASFLPRNQPLYAFCCFVIVPSFMATEVHFRIPHTMKHFLGQMLDALNINKLFPNVHISKLERLEFLKERSALLQNPETGETKPVTEAVIFTGTLRNAEKLRLVFDKKTLFISNGAGHNPVVISNNGNIDDAVIAVTTLQFYNQGQDCAAPNSILVHKDISEKFIDALRKRVKNTKVGDYHDPSTRIGPMSEPEDLPRIQQFLVNHMQWIDPLTPGIITTSSSTVAPTIIFKPLAGGGNFDEMFAPILFVQEYENDQQLADYFENPAYAPNAMYVTLYGSSEYVEGLVGRKINGELLHDAATFVHNTHLHAKGVERGTQQYGGYGQGASSLSINGKTIAMPTLPQRDLYEQLVKPYLNENGVQSVQVDPFTQTIHKNVSKLLQIKPTKSAGSHQLNTPSGAIYLDTQLLQKSAARFLKVNEEEIYHLLQEPNNTFIAAMELKDVALVGKMLSLLDEKTKMEFGEFESRLYAIPKVEGTSNNENRANQRQFFQAVYQLLFGENNGPRLAEFLWSIDRDIINTLLEAISLHARK